MAAFYGLASEELLRLRDMAEDTSHPMAEHHAARLRALEEIFAPPSEGSQQGGDAWEQAQRVEGDDAAARWEQAIARGETPDLDDED